ncbi:ash family protein [Klebsiella pneumoniae]|nr:ash family protein [Klebsiella pneumoniae]HDH0465551.1 ash family protein [Klebsiella pneumoniae]HDH0470615.1 ash family protein [Klebsiella pneumoniae]
MMMPVPQKAPFSGLLPFAVSRYSFAAVAKSAAGRENPSYSVATPDAPCVFFCVYAYVHLLFTHRFLSRCCICVMVAQAGQPSGWPVPIEAGFSPPSGLPPERENSGGGVNRYSMEVAPMATTLTPSHP